MLSNLSLFTFKPSPIEIGNGHTVHVRRLPAADKAAWIDSIPDGDDGATKSTAADNLDRSARLLQVALCDEAGAQLFTDHNDIKQIDEQTVEMLVGAVMRVNGWGKSGEDDVAKKPDAIPPSPAS